MKLKILVGNGRKIGLLTLPFLIVGIPLNIIFPEFFIVNDTSGLIFWISLLFLIVGFINWIWTVVLILTKIPRKQLITTGPYAIVKHPLYAGVALLVLPWAGLCLTHGWGLYLELLFISGLEFSLPKRRNYFQEYLGLNGKTTAKKLSFHGYKNEIRIFQH